MMINIVHRSSFCLPTFFLVLYIVLMLRQSGLNGEFKVALCIKNPVFMAQNRNAII